MFAAERFRLMTRVTEYYHKFIDLSYGTLGNAARASDNDARPPRLDYVAANAAAQTYSDVSDTHLPANLAGRCMNAAAGDADGDGDLDLALAMEFEPNILLLNDGKGRFTTARTACPALRTIARTSRSPTSTATAISTSCS